MHESSKWHWVGGAVAVQLRSRDSEPGKRTLAEAAFGTGAVVQARAEATEPAATVHAAAAIIAALADPEPASKVALTVGSVALALVILQRLGIQPEPGFDGT
jgi:hypothetical protein